MNACDPRSPNLGDQAAFSGFAQAYLQGRVLPLLRVKAEEYSEEKKPALANIIYGADAMRVTSPSYLLSLAHKHLYVLVEWATECRPSLSKGQIQEKIQDLVIYLLLLAFMIDHQPEKPR
jgi:hypothetical protein